MNPLQKNKVDISSMTPDEQRLFRLYGKLPNRNDLLQNKLKERKYFDSGDYALSKAGKASDNGVTSIGSQHPLPENIPHLSAAGPNGEHRSSISGGASGTSPPSSGSPVKEGSTLQRQTSVDEQDGVAGDKAAAGQGPAGGEKATVPIRWQG